LHTDPKSRIVFWVKKRLVFDISMAKYGLVGCAGIATNLGTMALFLTLGFQRGWIPSAIASVVSTLGNFILHNCWTFSDRQHQGARLVRGFLSFAIISAMGISLTTAFYVGFTRLVTHVTFLTSHRGTLPIPLACQFAAIVLASCTSYLLNREFTWPRAHSDALADSTQVQEI